MRATCWVTADADVSYGEYGKPRVAGGPEFNLTNDVGIVALAVAKRPVGIDLEEILARYRDVEDLITRKYYDEAERAAVGDGSTRRRRAAWARAWTRREAILKAMGTGFAVDPRKRPRCSWAGSCAPWSWGRPSRPARWTCRLK